MDEDEDEDMTKAFQVNPLLDSRCLYGRQLNQTNAKLPPPTYCPKGFTAFMVWGPVGPTYSVATCQLKVLYQGDNEDTMAGTSRKEMRAEAAKDKSKKHDLEAGIGDIQCGCLFVQITKKRLP